MTDDGNGRGCISKVGNGKTDQSYELLYPGSCVPRSKSRSLKSSLTHLNSKCLNQNGIEELTHFHFSVSPALTIIEKETTRRLANLMGFKQPNAGGLTLPGGSASNSTSMVIARNIMFPDTKMKGNGGHRFVVFTSVHGHYSVEKSAIMCGFGSEAVLQIPVDQAGRMIVSGIPSLEISHQLPGNLGCRSLTPHFCGSKNLKLPY